MSEHAGIEFVFKPRPQMTCRIWDVTPAEFMAELGSPLVLNSTLSKLYGVLNLTLSYSDDSFKAGGVHMMTTCGPSKRAKRAIIVV